jgi:Fic family protein
MKLVMSWDSDSPELKEDLGIVDRLAYASRTLVPPGREMYYREVARYRAVMSLVTGEPETSTGDHHRGSAEDAYALLGAISSDASIRIENGLLRWMNAVLLRGLREHPRGGQFRTEARIITLEHTREAHYRPARPEHVPALMERFVEDLQGWVDDGLPGPVVAALAHLGLMAIHPFEDGNDRTAILLSDMVLVQTGMSVDGMLSLSDFLAGNRREYQDVLSTALGPEFTPDLDVDGWLQWYVQALIYAAKRLESDLMFHNKKMDHLLVRDGGDFNERQMLGVMFAQFVEPISSSLYARLTGSSQSSAKADLNGLIRVGALERVGNGRQTRYRTTPEWSEAVAAGAIEAE